MASGVPGDYRLEQDWGAGSGRGAGSPWGEGRHRSPRTLRGLTLLHSGTGIQKGVMEKLICRRKVGSGLRRVRHQNSPGEGWAPTVPSCGPELLQALAPVLAASRQARGRQSPSWQLLNTSGTPSVVQAGAAHPSDSSQQRCLLHKWGFFYLCSWERSCGNGETHSLWPQGTWKLGVQDEGSRAKS